MADSLLTDLGKLREKQRVNTEVMLRLVDTVSAALDEKEAQQGASSSSSSKTAEGVLPKLADQHKAYHASLSKFTKAVDRVFLDAPPPVFLCRPSVALDPRRMDELVALHLYREGRARTAAKLVEEAGLSSAALQLEAYEGLSHVHEVIAAAMQRQELGLARQWAAEHREGLRRLGSNLEFQLARLQFLMLLRQEEAAGDGEHGTNGTVRGRRRKRGSDGAVLAFARQHLAPFAVAGDGHLEEVRALMGCLLYAGRLETSPYRALLSDGMWSEAMEALHSDSCRLLGLPVESPLSVCYRASLRALGPLAKMRHVVQSSKGDWEALEELPGEIDLGTGPSGLRFHSIFSCPVTREQASPDNPPMMLKCGHAICRNSLTRLLKGHGGHHKFKCFVCPTEQFLEDAQQLFF